MSSTQIDFFEIFFAEIFLHISAKGKGEKRTKEGEYIDFREFEGLGEHVRKRPREGPEKGRERMPQAAYKHPE